MRLNSVPYLSHNSFFFRTCRSIDLQAAEATVKRTDPVVLKSPWKSSVCSSHVSFGQRFVRHFFTCGNAKETWRNRFAILQLLRGLIAGWLLQASRFVIGWTAEAIPAVLVTVLLIGIVVVPGIRMTASLPRSDAEAVGGLIGPDIDDGFYGAPPSDWSDGMTPVVDCRGWKYYARRGDSFSRIAQRYHVPWKRLVEANQGFDDPDVMHPKDPVCIPSG